MVRPLWRPWRDWRTRASRGPFLRRRTRMEPVRLRRDLTNSSISETIIICYNIMRLHGAIISWLCYILIRSQESRWCNRHRRRRRFQVTWKVGALLSRAPHCPWITQFSLFRAIQNSKEVSEIAHIVKRTVHV